MPDKTKFVIIANPRTGTNHLIELLNSHPDITCHREVFHRDALYLLEGTRTDLLEKRNRDPIAFLHELYDSSPTRACGFKIFMDHNDAVLDAVLHDRDLKKIVLYRPNALAVYSSDIIAAAEKQYLIMENTRDRIDSGVNDRPRTKARATFDRKKFEIYWNAYQSHYRHVVEILNETNQDYLFLTYEDYINESLFRRVFPYLGLSQPMELHTRMKKMNASDILSRFINPDDVRGYLMKIGKQNWSHEAFMLWSQPEDIKKIFCEMSKAPVNIVGQQNKVVQGTGANQPEAGIVSAVNPGGKTEKRSTLLFVDYAVPQYDMFAGSRTNFMYLALLVKMGFEVKFLPADFRRVDPYSTELNRLGIQTLDGEWYRDNWQSWLRTNGKEINYVFFHKPDPAMTFINAVKNWTNAAIIYQCHDLHFLRLQRKAEVEKDKAMLAEAKFYEKKEDYIFSSSDILLTFSEVEEKIIKEKFPKKQVFTVPLFFYEDVPEPDRDFSKRRDLLFVGGCAHTPNKDAVSWFCSEVFPLIRRQISGIKLNVVGSNPPKDIEALQSESIRVLGRVSEDDLKRLYESVRLVVIPLRFGAGVKGKTIEALYHGVPIVSTSIGLEGIKGINQICEPQDEPAGFAAQVVSLYKDEKRLEELSEHASGFIKENFTSHQTEKLVSKIISASRKEAASTIAAFSTKVAAQKPLRAIAFYLPQYHPIPENDEWWGKGFTEWRNVAKAKPLFSGHYQPHIPADLGFYDLRLEETRIAQAELAREYGIEGFCYYHYWFNGKRLLERPLEDMLASGKPDFPFCICWANENWTRRWDGEDQNILMKLEYSEEDDRRHIRELFRIFEDCRYIRINGKPLFLVYRTENIPDPGRTAEVWREEARKAGIGELYLCRVESIGRCDPRIINFDASLEFAPDWNNKGPRVRSNNENVNERLSKFGFTDSVYEKNYVHYYDTLAGNMMKKPMPEYTWFRCVTPSWDNSARRQEGAHIFLGSTTEKYRQWLQNVIEYTDIYLSGEEKLVFINAWNEWAEGNHLEPDQRFGRAYLEATRQALQNEGHTTLHHFEKGAADILHPPGGKIAEHKIAELDKLLTEFKQKSIEKDNFLAQRELQILELEAQIAELLQSASWRITGPLRRAYEMTIKMKGRG